MKKLPLAIAVLLVITAVYLVISRKLEHKSDAPSSNDSQSGILVSINESRRGESNRVGKRVPRLTLEESLPQGTKISRSPHVHGAVEITLADGTWISARRASVTESGTFFEGPFEFSRPKDPTSFVFGMPGDSLVLSRDGSAHEVIEAKTE